MSDQEALTGEQLQMLAKLSEKQRSPQEYEQMLASLPDNVKRSFVEMDARLLKEHCTRHVQKRLAQNAAMAKFLTSADVLNIIESVYKNTIEDQVKVKNFLAKEALSGVNDRHRTIRR